MGPSDSGRGRGWLAAVAAASIAAGPGPRPEPARAADATIPPVSVNLHRAAETLGGGRYWLIVEGDSFAMHSPDADDTPAQLYNVGALPNLTAWQLQLNLAAAGTPVGVRVEEGVRGVERIDADDDYIMDAIVYGSTAWGVPAWASQLFYNGHGSFGAPQDLAGFAMSIEHDPSWSAAAVPGPLTADRLVCRLLTYSHGALNNTRRFRVHDRRPWPTALRATVGVEADARRFWSLGEGDPDAGPRGSTVPGHANALYPDVTLSDPHANGVFVVALYDELAYDTGDASDPGGGGLTTLLGPVFGKADAEGQWIPGAQLTYVADVSWSTWGFTEGAASGPAFPKTFTEDEYRHYLDVSCMSRDNTPVFLLHTDYSEHSEQVPPGAPGTIDSDQAYLDMYRSWAQMRERICAAIGLPAPRFLILTPHYHNRNRHTPIDGETPEEGRAASRFMQRGAALFAAEHPRASYFSLMQDTDERLFDGSPESDAWLADRGYDAWSPGGGYGVIDLVSKRSLLEYRHVHLVDTEVALFFAHRLKRALDAAAWPCPGDVNRDGITDVFDFADLAEHFGAGPGADTSMGDLTGDGMVDVLDFAELAADFGCAE